MMSTLHNPAATSTEITNIARAMGEQHIPTMPADASGTNHLNIRDVLALALQKDPSNSYALSHLGLQMRLKEKVLISGSVLPPKDLIIKAIDLWPENAAAYWHLSSVLERSDDVVTLSGNRTMTRIQLCSKSLELDPMDPYALASCANALLFAPKRWSRRLPFSIPADEESLLLKAIEIDPHCAEFYVHLACAMAVKRKESVTFSDSSNLTARELLLQALKLKSDYALAWALIGILPVGDSDTATFPFENGEQFTRRELSLRALTLDSNCGEAMFVLALTMKADEGPIELPGGIKLSRGELVAKAIEASPCFIGLYYLLASVREFGLVDGFRWTSKDLLLKAIDIYPNDSKHYNSLATFVPEESEIVLLNGRTMDYDQLTSENARQHNSAGVKRWDDDDVLPGQGSEHISFFVVCLIFLIVKVFWTLLYPLKQELDEAKLAYYEAKRKLYQEKRKHSDSKRKLIEERLANWKR